MSHDTNTNREFRPLRIAVLTVSDSRTEQTDKSGGLLVERLEQVGHILADKQIRPDDIYQIRACVSVWIADPETQVVITTGGTGVTGRDGTPEAVAPLLDQPPFSPMDTLNFRYSRPFRQKQIPSNQTAAS